MTLRSLVEAASAGHLAMAEVDSWVRQNSALYQRPPVETIGTTDKDPESLIEAYCDWEDRMHDLQRVVSRLSSDVFAARQSPGSQVNLSAVVLLKLSKVLDDERLRAQAHFAYGYANWCAGRFFDAAEELSDAVQLMDRIGYDRVLTATALSYLSDALRQDKRHDEAIRRSMDLMQRSRSLGLRGHEASALRDCGCAQAALGREREALDSLEEAVRLRRLLLPAEASQQSTSSLDAFLCDYGLVLRQASYFDKAVNTFFEVAEYAHAHGNVLNEALANSEIGYTWMQSGNTKKGAEYLRRAIALEEYRGATPRSTRWRFQLSTMETGAQISRLDGAGSATVEPFAHTPIIEGDEESVQLAVETANRLAVQGQSAEAMELALRALPLLIRQRNQDGEVTCRNILGICYDRLGKQSESIKEFQKAIQLADSGAGGTGRSLMLRYNLAKVHLSKGRNQLCADVLVAAMAHGRMEMQRSESFSFKRQVLAASLPIFELYALLLSHFDSPENRRNLLALSESVRARNLGMWANASAQLASANAGEDDEAIAGLLQKLRAVEVELDFRYLTGSLSALQANALQTVRRETQTALRDRVAHCGIRFQTEEESNELFFERVDGVLRELRPGTTVLSLFSVPEGVCATVFFRSQAGVESAGKFISWDREDRIEELSRWTRAVGAGGGRRGARALGQPQVPHSEAKPFEEVLELADQRLFNEVDGLMRNFAPETLILVPHGELALYPWWRLAERCSSVSALTVAPSMEMLGICMRRQGRPGGGTCVVPDATETLAHTEIELDYLRSLKHGDFERITSLNGMIKAGSRCNILHVAGHGLYNSHNPYHSGFVIGETEPAGGLLAQYLDVSRIGETLTFSFSGADRPGRYQLMTVADCLSRLSLPDCRLAVLSACECGLADPEGGGELIGLPNSLLVAGAKSVIAPLWPVDDGAAALLMRSFYL